LQYSPTNLLLLLVTILISLTPCSFVAGAQELSNGVLLRVVILSRHGVRAPTQSTDVLNTWRNTKTPGWPDFGVPPGYLTPKGEELVEKMGEYYRAYLDHNGLSDPAHCPDGLLIRADSDERTVMTAHGLGTGLVSNTDKPFRCRFAIHELANGVDPLFHPSEVLPDCKLDKTDVENAIGNPDELAQFAKNYQPQLDAEQDILQCCSQELCEHQPCDAAPILPPQPDQPMPGHGSRSCLLQLQQLPSCADAAKGQASIKGGLGIAQSFAEIMLLQYAQGVPVAFDKGKILDSLRLHVAVFDKVQRADIVAQRQGANLLYHLAYAINSGEDPGVPGGPHKFIVYVGHDTNIANVAALLDLHWQLPEYPQDDMPPGGALIFELRKAPGQGPSVHASFAAQSPDEMRKQPDEMRKQTGQPPARVPVPIKACGGSDGSCSMPNFQAIIGPILDKNEHCVTDRQGSPARP
jgi:4-phytase/acid phosphatase